MLYCRRSGVHHVHPILHEASRQAEDSNAELYTH